MMTNTIVLKNVYLGITMVLLVGILVVGGIGNVFSQNTTDASSTIPPSNNDTGFGNLNITDIGNAKNWTDANSTINAQ